MKSLSRLRAWPRVAVLFIICFVLHAGTCQHGAHRLNVKAKKDKSCPEFATQDATTTHTSCPEFAIQGNTHVLEVPHDGQEDIWSPFEEMVRLRGGMQGQADVKAGYLGQGGDQKVRTDQEQQRGNSSIGSSTSPNSMQEHIAMRPVFSSKSPSILPVFGKLQQGEVTSTEQLVEGLSDSEAKQQAALLRLFKAYNVFFEEQSMARPTPEDIYEYSTLAKITLPTIDNPTRQQKNFLKKFKSHLETYTEVWRKKVEAGFRINKFTQGVVEFLKHIDVQAFGRDTMLLRKLGQSLLDQLPLSTDAYTADQYPSHKDTLSAIKQALIKIRAISEDKLDPQAGLYKSFKERLDKIMASQYYPVVYQARCIAQNLTRMEKKPDGWEKAGQAAGRLYAGFKGLLQVTQGILGAVYFDLDLEEVEAGLANIVGATLDTMDALEEAEAKRADCMAKVLGTTTYKTEPWYADTQKLLVIATACLLPETAFEKAKQEEREGFANYKNHEDYQKQAFARYQGQADEVVKKTPKGRLATLQYGIVQHLTLVGMQAHSQEVRKACAAALIAKLKDTAWHGEQGVIEGLLAGLKNMSIKHSNEASGQAAKEALAALAKDASALAQQQEQAAASSCFSCCSSTQKPVASSPAGVHLAWAQRRRSSVTAPPVTGKLFEKVKRHIASSPEVREAEEAERVPVQAVHHRKLQQLPAPAPIPFFVGREDMIKKIMDALKDKGDKPQIHLLCGPGGMGKSQLAIQLFNKLEATGQYDHVFWLQADTPTQLQQDYFSLAAQLGMEVDKKDPNAIRIIRHRLADKHCLWVFDDVPNSQAIRDFIPLQQGHVLLTSRNSKQSDWGHEVQPWSLEQFDQTNLMALAKHFDISLDPADEATTKYLLSELSGYPFVLAQFFSLCQSQRQRPSELIGELQEGRRSAQERELVELLEETPEQQVVYNKTIVQVLRTSLEALESAKDGAHALGLLSRFAYLDPKGIPVTLIERLDEEISKRKVRKALKLLEQYSLAQWDNKAELLYVHAVTQHIVRRYHPCKELEGLVKGLIAYVGDWDDAHNHQAEWTTILQHGQRLVEQLPQDEPSQAAYDLTKALGQACDVACLYEGAWKWYEKNLQIANKAHSDQHHQDVGDSLHRLGYVYSRKGIYEKAKKLLEQSLTIKKQIYGESHPEVAGTLHEIANVHLLQGDYPEARKLFEQSLAINKSFYGPKHPKVAATLYKLAHICLRQGDDSGARKLYEQILAMRKSFYGEQHPKVAAALHGLAYTHYREEDYKTASDLYRQALAMKKKVYGGKQHPEVAGTLHELGMLYTSQGDYKVAEDFYNQALAMKKKICGDEHPFVAWTQYRIGELFWKWKRYQEAIVSHKKALETRLAIFGTEHHREIAMSYAGLGSIYVDQQRYEEANKVLFKSLEIFTKVFASESHPEIASSYRALGHLCLAQQNYQSAEEYFSKAYEMLKKYFKESHPDVQKALKALQGARAALTREK